MITFVVPGQRQPAGTRQAGGGEGVPSRVLDELRGGRLKDSIRIGAQRSGGEGQVVVSADPGNDVVVLHVAGGPALVLHPENARDLLLAQSADAHERGGGGTQAGRDGSTVIVPSRLQWHGLGGSAGARGATRGPGDVILWGIDVITGLVTDKAADFAASAVVRRVDAQVDPGVYSLQADALVRLKGHEAPMARVPAAAHDGPLLVFVHGAFSETSGTFSKLWVEHPQRVRTLFEKYGGRVYALDHPTLGASPVANALTLANACPTGAKLHLVTHSRGGLVAEVLARVCADLDDAFEPFTAKADKDLRRELRELAAVVRERRIRVDRMVRVACPARGTLLASGRLDAYVSVLKWTLELAGIPVAPQLVDFLGEVATRRADPGVLPGLAALVPGGPLVRWLHGVKGTIGGDLRVVAGDLEGDSVTSWVKTLLADAFFWTDNDLVVQTRSMYGGAPREASATFVLEQGGKVSHFNYFSNERTAEAIVGALVHDQPHGFRKIGPLSWAGEVASGARAALDTTGAADKPAVVLLGLKRPGDDGTGGPGGISLFYDDLVSFFSSTHEVIEFAFDWRRAIEDEGRRLADRVERALAARQQTGRPVRLLAHSVGGVVARTMQLVRPGAWKSLMARPGARLLMLGTPNEGFWAPMQVLSGDDTFGNALAATGPPFRDADSRQLMATFPGFVQLQAGLLNEKLGLSSQTTWRHLADADLTRVLAQSPWHNLEVQRDAHRWGVPAQDVLDQAVGLWKNLEAQRKSGVLGINNQVLLVVGKAPLTPDGYDVGHDGLVYLETPGGGDGRVTLESAMLPGVKTWQLDAEHAALATKKDAFAAYLELLETGTTGLLTPLRAAATTRGVASVASPPVRSRPSRTAASPQPLESESGLYSVEGRRGSRPVRPPGHGTALRITVLNGDLTFVRQPLLLGHYRALRLTGTERVVDRLIGGAMSRSLKANLYPDAPGMHQVFVNTQLDPANPWRLPRPEAVVVLGLGEEGKLRPTHLVKAVRQGVICWAQRMAEKPDDAHVPAFVELAATLIGSGGTGITVGQSAQLIAQGVREANERLAAGRWPLVSHLYLTELYLDRATEAWRALEIQAGATPGHYVVAGTVQAGEGALLRPLEASYRGADYDFISATAPEGAEAAIEYTLDTKRARTEVRAQATQVPLVRELVASASNDRSQDTRIGRTLFQLLVPVEMEPFFSGTTEMVIELDNGTAGIPWELLDTNTEGGGDARPWAIRAKLLRKLRTARFRVQVVDAGADSSILVIGEPECDPTRYRRLPGARAEARAVATLLSGLAPLSGGKVTSLISPEDPSECGADARTVMNTLLERDWRIVHIAGHGEPSRKAGEAGGVVLSSGTFLGPNEIASMRVVPELVFVNCCHLAARNTAEVLGRPPDRALFAAGVAEKLIQIGVRCVIAAGWAVDDQAANAFATTFYGALLKGQRFIDAVAHAREVALARGGNTWAAYQCYGDPDWQFRPDGLDAADAQRAPSPMDEFAGVASPSGLRIALETLAVKGRFQGAGPEEQHPKIRYLERRFGDTWGGIGQIAEAFGTAWAEAGQRPNAIRWYRQAIAVENGTASLRAAEQLSNTLARVAAETVDEAVQHSRTRKSAAATLATATREGRALIAEAMALLDKLIALQPTMERESLYGSAYKRLALIEAAAGRPAAEARAIAGMKLHYRNAESIGRAHEGSNVFYPVLNRIAADLALNAGRRGWKGLDADAVSSARRSLAAKVRDDPDFWSVVGQTDLDVYEAVARRDLAGRRRSIESAYEDLRARVGAPRYWSSVYDTARFVLQKYAGRAAGAERKAASAVLDRLESFARAEG